LSAFFVNFSFACLNGFLLGFLFTLVKFLLGLSQGTLISNWFNTRLLQRVRQLVRDQALALVCRWRILSGAEVNILAQRECASVDVVGEFGSLSVLV
jgi:hypothetical protein